LNKEALRQGTLRVILFSLERELVADRKKIEGHCLTGQNPQWAVVPMEEEFCFPCQYHSTNVAYSFFFFVSDRRYVNLSVEGVVK